WKRAMPLGEIGSQISTFIFRELLAGATSDEPETIRLKCSLFLAPCFSGSADCRERAGSGQMERTQLIKKSSRYNLYLPSLTTSNVESADRAQQEEREPAQLRVYQASRLPRFQSDFWAIGTWSRTIRPASGNAIATRRNVIIRLELIP